MKTIELFCGTKSFSKVMAQNGHSILTIDNDPKFEPDNCESVFELDADFYWRNQDNQFDILWASPPCTCFSVASIGTHWGGGKCAYEPKTTDAKNARDLVMKTQEIIFNLNPKWWFVENPRGVLRKMNFMRNFGERKTITYCQYGDTRMKPTDIWTNAYWWKPRPVCKNGDKCHESAPRGSKTGTQGLRGAKERGVIPPELFEEILNQMPK